MHVKIVVYNEIHMKQGLKQVQYVIRNVSYERVVNKNFGCFLVLLKPLLVIFCAVVWVSFSAL